MHYEDLITDVPGARRELVWFALVLFSLTAINVSMLFVRGQPLIQHRQYDFQSPFLFTEIMHDGELRFKACFHKSVSGGFYLCFLFAPPKEAMLKEGRYTPDRFESIFADQTYIKQYINKFREKRWDKGKDLQGFEVTKLRNAFRITPVF